MASSAAEMSPPAAVSATEMVSWRALRRLATSSAMALRASGGKAVVVIAVGRRVPVMVGAENTVVSGLYFATLKISFSCSLRDSQLLGEGRKEMVL